MLRYIWEKETGTLPFKHWNCEMMNVVAFPGRSRGWTDEGDWRSG